MSACLPLFLHKEMTGQVLVSIRLQLWSRYSGRWRPSHKALCTSFSERWTSTISSLPLPWIPICFLSRSEEVWPVTCGISTIWELVRNSNLWPHLRLTESESLGWVPRISGFKILLGDSHHYERFLSSLYRYLYIVKSLSQLLNLSFVTQK